MSLYKTRLKGSNLEGSYNIPKEELLNIITDVREEIIEQIETVIELDNSDIILEQTDIP